MSCKWVVYTQNFQPKEGHTFAEVWRYNRELYGLAGFKKALRGVSCRSTQTRLGALFWAIRFGFRRSAGCNSDFWSVTPIFGL